MCKHNYLRWFSESSLTRLIFVSSLTSRFASYFIVFRLHSHHIQISFFRCIFSIGKSHKSTGPPFVSDASFRYDSQLLWRLRSARDGQTVDARVFAQSYSTGVSPSCVAGSRAASHVPMIKRVHRRMFHKNLTCFRF